MTQPETLLTVGEIARRLGQEVHRIEYVIRSRNIRPVGWAGPAGRGIWRPGMRRRPQLSRLKAVIVWFIPGPRMIGFGSVKPQHGLC